MLHEEADRNKFRWEYIRWTYVPSRVRSNKLDSTMYSDYNYILIQTTASHIYDSSWTISTGRCQSSPGFWVIWSRSLKVNIMLHWDNSTADNLSQHEVAGGVPRFKSLPRHFARKLHDDMAASGINYYLVCNNNVVMFWALGKSIMVIAPLASVFISTALLVNLMHSLRFAHHCSLLRVCEQPVYSVSHTQAHY